MSLPLPLWNHNRGNILAAEAAREQARLAYEKARAQAVADIATALLSYDDSAGRWKNFRDSIRPKSQEVRKTKSYAYQKGGARWVDAQFRRPDGGLIAPWWPAGAGAEIAIYGMHRADLLDMLVAERDDNDVRLAAMQAASDTAVALATLKAVTTEIQPAQVQK